MKFAKSFEEAVKGGNANFLENSFYLLSTEKRYLSQMNVSSKKESRYRIEVSKRFSSMMKNLIEGVSHGGYFHLVKFYIKDKVPHAVFGVYSGKVDFIDFELEARGEKIYIVDFFSCYNGSYFSNTIKDHIRNELEYGNLGGIYVNALKELYNVEVYMDRGQYERAWNAYGRIMNEFQQQKTFQVVRVNLSQWISEEAYVNSVQNFIDSYPEDERFVLLQSINLAIVQGNREKALNKIFMLGKMLGESLANQYSKAVDEIKVISEKFNLTEADWNDFLSIYPEFLTSKDYLEFKEIK